MDYLQNYELFLVPGFGQLLFHLIFEFQFELEFEMRYDSNVIKHCSPKMISLIIEGYCSMTLGVLQVFQQ